MHISHDTAGPKIHEFNYAEDCVRTQILGVCECVRKDYRLLSTRVFCTIWHRPMKNYAMGLCRGNENC